MSIRCSRYGNDIDRGVGKDLLGGMIDFRCRMVFGRIVGGLGCPLDDGVESEAGCYLDEGDVEDFGRHAGGILAAGSSRLWD